MKKLKNRYIPFGYQVKNGAVVMVPTEVKVVQRIFSHYLAGMSLKAIAASLTDEQVEYLPKQSQWNQNRIVRILDDVRYLGNEVYAAVIDREMFQEVQNVKLSRNTQKGYERGKVISPSAVSIVCSKCGGSVKRIHDNRTKYKQKYVCANKDCQIQYKISEDEMLTMITELLSEAELVVMDRTDAGEILEIHRLQQEAARAVDYCHTDAQKARSLILECADKRYQSVSKGRADFDKLKRYLNHADMVVDRRTAAELIRQITLISDEKIVITLINGQTVEKENFDERSNTESQDSQGDSSAH